MLPFDIKVPKKSEAWTKVSFLTAVRNSRAYCVVRIVHTVALIANIIRLM